MKNHESSAVRRKIPPGFYRYEQGMEKVKRILIVSNRKCTHAVHLYRKFGFEEMTVNKEQFPFERADIAFQMKMEDTENGI